MQDLRDFSHQDTGERVLADLNQCLDSTANIVWPMMKHVVVLEKQYAELPSVACYPMQLKQVFMNLLVNAYQAIEEKLGGRAETGLIRLRTEAAGAASCPVSDTGIGIARTTSSASSIRSSPPRRSAPAPGSGSRPRSASCSATAAASRSRASSAGQHLPVELPLDGDESADDGS